VDLYYRAYDVHEVLAHRAAEIGGYYERAGVKVELKDGSGAKAKELESVTPVTIGVGGAVLSRLVHGANWAVVSVNTQHPLFWFAAGPSIVAMEQLKGKRVAAPPTGTAPALFCRIVLRRHGLDLERDCTYLPTPPGPAAAMLQRGEVEACFVNAAPFELERSGCRIFFFGTELQAATTGLAVNQNLIEADSPEVTRLVQAHRMALERLHGDREFALRAILEIHPQFTSEDAALLLDRYIHPYWTHNGRPDRGKAEESLKEMARELGMEAAPAFPEVFKVV